MAALLVAALLAPSGRSADPDRSPGIAAPSAAESFTTAPPAEVQRVHDVLHDIAALCKPGADAAAQRQLAGDADTILAFASRYPNARFPIDDETGRTLSLLLATRDDLRACAPAAAASIDPAIPPQYRDLPSTSP